MKKTIFICTLFVTLVTALSIRLHAEKVASGITLENIEALSNGEGSSVKCMFNGSVDCPISSTKVLYVVQD